MYTFLGWLLFLLAGTLFLIFWKKDKTIGLYPAGIGAILFTMAAYQPVEEKPVHKAPEIEWHGATVEKVGPVVENEIPAGTKPRWAYAGFLPSGAYALDLRISAMGSEFSKKNFYLADADLLGEPQPIEKLDELFVETITRLGPQPFGARATSAVLPLTSMPYRQTHGFDNGARGSALYVQCSPSQTPQSFNAEFLIDEGEDEVTEEFVVTVDRKGMSFTPNGKWSYLWIIPIRDVKHQSSLVDQSVPIAGADETVVANALQVLARRLDKPTTEEAARKVAQGYIAKRPSQNALYQGLTWRFDEVGEDKAQGLRSPKAFPFEQLNGKTVHLRLNAPADPLASEVQPATVRIRWRRSR